MCLYDTEKRYETISFVVKRYCVPVRHVCADAERACWHRWHDDKAHGWGMKAFANGDRHEGEYCLDLRQGSGTYHWANGDCYEGDWEVSYNMYKYKKRRCVPRYIRNRMASRIGINATLLLVEPDSKRLRGVRCLPVEMCIAADDTSAPAKRCQRCLCWRINIMAVTSLLMVRCVNMFLYEGVSCCRRGVKPLCSCP